MKYDRFLKPLENYWNTNYASVLEYIKQKNPGLSYEEYEKLVRDIFYSASPFRGTENCTHPQIDFSKYTLSGKDANSGGCDFPEYNIKVERDNIAREYILRISIRRIGNCEMGIFENKWILIPKIPKGFSVKFENIELN